MGYRSEVFYGAEFSSAEEAKASVIAAKLKFNEWHDLEDLRRDDQVVYFHAEQIKWYSSYPEVQFIDDLFDFFGNSCDAACIYYRIGDEIDDIEHRSFGNNEIDCEYLYNSVYVRSMMEIELSGEVI